ncbi:hypothetical protein SCG7109_AC_00330 [Chlamydiales bacterium SCGC AG-110-M15]|nr:hypothetical protein SCG7109_AC_00330 [Chlamydiales bacterium SCGC AG-110-M15]
MANLNGLSSQFYRFCTYERFSKDDWSKTPDSCKAEVSAGLMPGEKSDCNLKPQTQYRELTRGRIIFRGETSAKRRIIAAVCFIALAAITALAVTATAGPENLEKIGLKGLGDAFASNKKLSYALTAIPATILFAATGAYLNGKRVDNRVWDPRSNNPTAIDRERYPDSVSSKALYAWSP